MLIAVFCTNVILYFKHTHIKLHVLPILTCLFKSNYQVFQLTLYQRKHAQILYPFNLGGGSGVCGEGQDCFKILSYRKCDNKVLNNVLLILLLTESIQGLI